MLKVNLNRLKPEAKEVIAEEQAGFRAEKTTTEQTLNLSFLCEKYLQYQQNLFHVFIDLVENWEKDMAHNLEMNKMVNKLDTSVYDEAVLSLTFIFKYIYPNSQAGSYAIILSFSNHFM